MPHALRRTLLIAAAGLSIANSTALAQAIPTAVYSTFEPINNSVNAPIGGTRQFTTLSSIHRSPNGQRWLLIGIINGASTSRQVLIAGLEGPTPARTVIAQLGQAVPGLAGRTINLMDDHRINDAGQFAFKSNLLPTGAPSVLFYTGSVNPTPTFSYVAALGQDAPTLPSWTFQSGFYATLLDNTGRYGFHTNTTDGLQSIATIFFNGQVISRENDDATRPTMLPMQPEDLWSDFVQRRTFINAAGDQFLTFGTTFNAGDVVAFNNVALVQEGQAVPGLGPTDPLEGVTSCWMDPGGRWFIRGTLNDSAVTAARTDFILSNGVKVAKRGDPIVPGSALSWDRASATQTANGFQFNVGNDDGHFVVAGWAFDQTNRVPVAVLDGSAIVAQRGDAIDMDSDGLLDDDAFIMGFKTETGQGQSFLTNSGQLWMNVSVMNGAGTNLGDAIVKLQLDIAPPACRVDFDQNGTVSIDDIFIYLNAWFAGCNGTQPGAPCNGRTTDFSDDGAVTIDDIFIYLNAWFEGC